MLGDIFYWIFNMSIASFICAIPALCIRLVKKIPRKIFLWLWLIPFIRMCIPVGISGKYSLMTLISKFTTKTVTIYYFNDDFAFTMMNHIMVADSYFPINYKINIFENLFSVASILWIIVALSFIIAFFIIYIVTIRELSSSKHLKNNIYLSDKVKTPSVYGIIKPKIIIPYEYNEVDMNYILMHERMHIKRCDNLVRVLALIIVCVHWFNPMSWIFLKMLYSDIELACDESVLSKCNEVQTKEYANTLVSTVEKSNVFASSFGGAKIRIRIENILSYKKISIFSAIGFVVLILSMAYILLTNSV